MIKISVWLFSFCLLVFSAFSSAEIIPLISEDAANLVLDTPGEEAYNLYQAMNVAPEAFSTLYPNDLRKTIVINETSSRVAAVLGCYFVADQNHYVCMINIRKAYSPVSTDWDAGYAQLITNDSYIAKKLAGYFHRPADGVIFISGDQKLRILAPADHNGVIQSFRILYNE